MAATWAARLWGVFCERVVDPRAGMAVLTSMNLLMMVLQCCFLLTERVWWWIYLNTYTLGLFTVALYPGAFLSFASQVRLPWSREPLARFACYQALAFAFVVYGVAPLFGPASPCGYLNRIGYFPSIGAREQCFVRYVDTTSSSPLLIALSALFYSSGVVIRAWRDSERGTPGYQAWQFIPSEREAILLRLWKLYARKRVVWWAGLVLQLPALTLLLDYDGNSLPLSGYPLEAMGAAAYGMTLFTGIALWVYVGRLESVLLRTFGDDVDLVEPKGVLAGLRYTMVTFITACVSFCSILSVLHFIYASMIALLIVW